MEDNKDSETGKVKVKTEGEEEDDLKLDDHSLKRCFEEGDPADNGEKFITSLARDESETSFWSKFNMFSVRYVKRAYRYLYTLGEGDIKAEPPVGSVTSSIMSGTDDDDEEEEQEAEEEPEEEEDDVVEIFSSNSDEIYEDEDDDDDEKLQENQASDVDITTVKTVLKIVRGYLEKSMSNNFRKINYAEFCSTLPYPLNKDEELKKEVRLVKEAHEKISQKYKKLHELQEMLHGRGTSKEALENAKLKQDIKTEKELHEKTKTTLDVCQKKNEMFQKDIQDERLLHMKTKAMLETSQKRIKTLTKVNAELRRMQESDQKSYERLKELYEEDKQKLKTQRRRLLDLTADLHNSTLDQHHRSARSRCSGGGVS